MQKLYGYIRRACQEFDLIEDGDRIAVGVSGGKDSVVLLAGLAGMRRFYEKKYDIVCVTLDPRFGGADTDYSPVARLCESWTWNFILSKPTSVKLCLTFAKNRTRVRFARKCGAALCTTRQRRRGAIKSRSVTITTTQLKRL